MTRHHVAAAREQVDSGESPRLHGQRPSNGKRLGTLVARWCVQALSRSIKRRILRKNRRVCGETKGRSEFDATNEGYGEMRVPAFVSILCIGYITISQSAFGMEAVMTCTLGSDGSHTIALLRDRSIDSTTLYYLSKDGDAPVRLYQGDEDQSRCDDIQFACVGTKEHAFVLSAEFPSNYLQGVAIRYNTHATRWERVDLAERRRPASVYFDAEGLVVLVPHTGRNESVKRYIIYRYDASKGQAEQTYSGHLPKLRGTRIPAN